MMRCFILQPPICKRTFAYVVLAGAVFVFVLTITWRERKIRRFDNDTLAARELNDGTALRRHKWAGYFTTHLAHFSVRGKNGDDL